MYVSKISSLVPRYSTWLSIFFYISPSLITSILYTDIYLIFIFYRRDICACDYVAKVVPSIQIEHIYWWLHALWLRNYIGLQAKLRVRAAAALKVYFWRTYSWRRSKFIMMFTTRNQLINFPSQNHQNDWKKLKLQPQSQADLNWFSEEYFYIGKTGRAIIKHPIWSGRYLVTVIRVIFLTVVQSAPVQVLWCIYTHHKNVQILCLW